MQRTLTKAGEIARGFLEELEPPRLRTHREFAEQELVLADGPMKGLKFNAAFMPFMALVLTEFDLLNYHRFFGSGPTQGGKTLLFFIEPALYHLFEICENVILGAPVVELAQAIYSERLLPSIKASRYRAYLPSEGSGSRGGKADAIHFKHGPTLRFMGAGGGDHQRSSHPARVVILTELDKMDTPGKSSREADPVSQLEARTHAFGDSAIIYGECTMSTESGRIFREVEKLGTGSQPLFKCPMCSVPVSLSRKSFHGWETAEDSLAASEEAHFICPNCSAKWTESDRRTALRSPVLISRGQEISEEGQIMGDPPRTNTFGFRWTALASNLRTMSSIGAQMYAAEEAGDDASRRMVSQFIWAEPYSGELVDLSRVDVDTILRKMTRHERGEIPSTSKRLVLGIDVGSYVCWWTLYSFTADAQGHVVDFGSIDVPQEAEGRSKGAVLAALRAFRDNHIMKGWAGKTPHRVIVDSGWEPEVAYAFVKESGQGTYVAAKGFGSKSRNGVFKAGTMKTKSRLIGNRWNISTQSNGILLLQVDADYWKAQVHDGFGIPEGASGTMTIFKADKRNRGMRIFARQMTAEYREVDLTPGTTHGYRWVVASKQNHYLDCASMARCGADLLGIRAVKPKKRPAKNPSARAQQSQARKIRTKY